MLGLLLGFIDQTARRHGPISIKTLRTQCHEGRRATRRAIRFPAPHRLARVRVESSGCRLQSEGIDPSSADLSNREGSTPAKLSGAMKRDDLTMQMALGEPQLPRRRFAAARGAFLGWSSGVRSSRLITSARTREQSGRRAFAAELLAPSEYVRRRAGGSAIFMFRVEEIASELEVSPAVVKWQAQKAACSGCR